MRAIREGWSHWREAERREEDERDRLMRLLAYRDAFFTLLAMLVVLLVLQPLLLHRLQDPLGRGVLALFPLAALTTACLVFVCSWRLRSGGVEGRVAMVKAGRMVAGFVVGYALITGLSLAGFIPLDVRPSFLIGSAVGVLVAAILVLVLYRRTDSRNAE